MVEQSLAVVTALAPVIGDERTAKLAQRALAEGRTIRELAKYLDPRRMTEPGFEG